jgi:hypothetical protein
VPTGTGPLTITGIPIGSHQVKVISSPHFQYRDYVTDVTIVEDEETIVEVYISGAVVTPTPTPSLKELIASLVVKPYSPINCCDDCTPQPWIKGTVTPESIPTPSLEELIAGYQKIEYSSYAATQGIKQCGGPINGIVTPEPVLPY